jgi:hypothetical protein
MANRLAQETSPYLLQHAGNPVDWYPWGEEALALARKLDKPILLSVGYSACHWCHVMAHESFEDPQTAAVMNQHFINIKVDREERPDIDHIYQAAHALMTRRSGGWPLTMFLAPNQVPFYGGTYFPPIPRYNLPGFADLLLRVSAAYHEQRAAIDGQASGLVEALEQRGTQAAAMPDGHVISAGVEQLQASFDPHHGGLGGAPKFPNAPDWTLLLRQAAYGDGKALGMVKTTLSRMAAGGIYDHLAGGFCRYSVDERWEIPHFEKMLYDNGQLLSLYSNGWLLTREPRWKVVVEESVHWLLNEMLDDGGAFYAALDADSEGQEGKFYVWQRGEIQAVLGHEAYTEFATHYGLNRSPNFEHEHWHLCVQGKDTGAPQLVAARRVLLDIRNQRIRPGRDEKILTSWNGLVIKGLAQAGRAFGQPPWIAAAQAATDFIRQHLILDGQLFACYKESRARFNAYLDDHAFLLDALLELLQTEFRQQDLDFAVLLAEALLARFEDADNGGFFFTSHDHEPLIQRPKSPYDNAIPAGNGIAVFALQRLGHLLGEVRYLRAAERALQAFGSILQRNPAGCPSLLCALQEWQQPPTVVVLCGATAAVAEWKVALDAKFRPNCLVVAVPDGVKTGYPTLDKKAESAVNAHVCRGVECLPAIDRFEYLMASLS